MFLRFIGLSYIYGGEWENTRNFWKFMDLLFARLGVMPSDEAGAKIFGLVVKSVLLCKFLIKLL